MLSKYHYDVMLQYTGACFKIKLEQLERLRSEVTPRRLMITHTIESCWVPKQGRMTLKI